MGSSHDVEFDKLIEAFTLYLLKMNPVTASFLGQHGYDEEFADYSEKALAERAVKLATFKKSFKTINRRGLTADARADLDLILNYLEVQEIYLKKIMPQKLLPAVYLDEVLFGIYALLVRDFVGPRERALSLTRRLSQVGALLKTARQQLANPPEVYVDSALRSLAGAVSFLDEVVPEFAGTLRGALAEALVESKDDAVAELKAFELYLRNDVLPTAKGSFSIGKPLYDQLLKLDHHLPYTNDQLLKLANSEIEALEAELAQTATAISKKKSWRDLVGELKKDHPTAAGLVGAYKKEVKALRQFIVDKNLFALGEGEEVEVVPTPAFAAPLIPCVAYVPPAPHEAVRRGLLWVTIPTGPAAETEDRLRMHPNVGLTLRAIHETYPGHHTQLTHVGTVKGKLLRQILRPCLTTEGWALYCEDMMREQGALPDPKQRLLALRDALWRAYRVTLDVGLQNKTIGYQRAVTILIEKVGLEPAVAEAEVRRYCQTPTEPMCGLVGKLEIKRLQQDYAKRAGSSYTLKAFHEDFLSHGLLPIAKIRQAMELEK